MKREKQKTIFCEGILKKRGEYNTAFKTRYFLLTSDALEYYKPGEKKLQGSIDLDKAKVEKMNENNKYIFSVTVPGRQFILESDSELDMNKWVNAIKDRIPFSSLEREKKEEKYIRSENIFRSMFKKSGTISPIRKLSSQSDKDPDKEDVEEKNTEMSKSNSFNSQISKSLKENRLSLSSSLFGINSKPEEYLTPPTKFLVSQSSDSQKGLNIFNNTKIDPKSIDRKYTGLYVNFFSIMTVPSIQEAFMKHLANESNTEPLEFLLEIEKFKCDNIFSISDEDLDLFHHICKEFIEPKSSKEINISAQIKDNILKAHKQNQGDWSERETPVYILEPARSLVLGDFKGDVFPRFLASDLGYDSIVKNYNNSKVISIDPSVSVRYKLEKFYYGSNFSDTSQTLTFAKALSSKNSIRESYLSKLYRNIFNFEAQLDPSSPIPSINHEVDVDTSEVKIYLTLIEKENKRVMFRKFQFKKLLSPVQHEIKLEYEEKLEYIPALVIGKWLLYWDNFELCIPKRILSQSPIHHTLTQIGSIKDFDSHTTKLSDLIANYNVTKKYKYNKKEKDKNALNSQEFIDELLKDMELQCNLTPCLERLTQKFKEKGSIELYFSMSPEFQKTFNFKQSEISFKSHVELDNFVRKLLQDELLFKDRFREEWEYLKWLDYMFWYRVHIIRIELRRLKSEKEPDKNAIEIEEYQESISAPCCEGDKILCPFE